MTDDLSRPGTRWVLVVVAAGVMGAAGTYQFAWSSLSGPVGSRVGASPTGLGNVFTAYIVAQTLVQFPAGSIRDRYGPRAILVVSALFLASGYAGLAVVRSYPLVLAAYTLGGVGCGIAYTVAVNTPVKWFTDRRGLATGAVTMAYGAVSVAAIPLLQSRLDASYRATLLTLAVVVGGAGLLAALVLRDPPTGTDATDDGDAVSVDETAAIGWRSVLRSWQFWVLFGVMAVVNGVGLMLIGQSVGFTRGLGMGSGTATTVASVIALADAGGIVVVSALSDRLGGERTVGASLLLCGCSLAGAVVVGVRGLAPLFVLLVGATAFFRSPVFAVFPSLVGRYYGRARSSENYALVYSAKVPGGILGGTVAGFLIARTGWTPSFLAGAALLALAGLATLTLRSGDLVDKDGHVGQQTG
ncbi:MFS transporter [Haloarcula halophila]|uniref:MFS transporter n=1 Tax=Haloarcula TaxID=2237 RepID=UPI0023E43838|nr:MFS transporter [Halomicroarcula sp. DFY41]